MNHTKIFVRIYFDNNLHDTDTIVFHTILQIKIRQMTRNYDKIYMSQYINDTTVIPNVLQLKINLDFFSYDSLRVEMETLAP